MANIADFSRRADELQAQDFTPIPDGVYNAEIKSADMKDTKDGTGQYINMSLTVLGPTHANRIVFSMINIVNKNPAAEEIGLRQLKELRIACGIASLRDTDELIGKALKIKVGTQKSESYGDKNVVKAFMSASGSEMPIATATPSSSTPPWAKK